MARRAASASATTPDLHSDYACLSFTPTGLIGISFFLSAGVHTAIIRRHSVTLPAGDGVPDAALGCRPWFVQCRPIGRGETVEPGSEKRFGTGQDYVPKEIRKEIAKSNWKNGEFIMLRPAKYHEVFDFY